MAPTSAALVVIVLLLATQTCFSVNSTSLSAPRKSLKQVLGSRKEDRVDNGIRDIKTDICLDNETVSITMFRGCSCRRPQTRLQQNNYQTDYVLHNDRRWFPPNTRTIEYGFHFSVPGQFYAPISAAFSDWNRYIPFTFKLYEESELVDCDIQIGFVSGEHWCYISFDDPKEMAHAAVTGDLHFNADLNWSIGQDPNAYHIETVARHEIGHILGLRHSTDRDALMYPAYRRGTIKFIERDYICGIQDLYEMAPPPPPALARTLSTLLEEQH